VSWSLFVPGAPRPKGSLRFVAHARTGKPVPVGRNKLADQWGARVSETARQAGWQPVESPVSLWLRFGFERPRSHYRTGRHAGRLRDHAPVYPTSRQCGDLDKLSRGVLDALTGIAYADDSQVVQLRARKVWASELWIPGVRIRMAVLTAGAVLAIQTAEKVDS
jgi:crossover junction endodeoxyribonuclease RusA